MEIFILKGSLQKVRCADAFLDLVMGFGTLRASLLTSSEAQGDIAHEAELPCLA